MTLLSSYSFSQTGSKKTNDYPVRIDVTHVGISFKHLTLINKKLIELDTKSQLYDNCRIEVRISDSISVYKSLIIAEKDTVIKAKDRMIDLKNDQLFRQESNNRSLQDNIKFLNKEIVRQRRSKNLIFGGGLCLTGFITALWLTK